ncbi:ABC transporter permease [Natronococcus sp. A-GB7]|uniref:ABC transporter permease n=1 Tax=Natronococcus sp. A-GB7 TaxID=3037649 RepID=UPI00241CD2D1|nr:ABC transporter permease [Natronococcus sp. A-GB7]MDG5821306.1 ABC transporter permease [Natronococcus sp. A-GB7]
MIDRSRRWANRSLARLQTAGRLTIAQFRQQKLQLLLAVIGVALAVLAITLLVSTGLGVLETGQEQFDTADRDLWVTSSETRMTADGGGGFENTLYDSRTLSTEMESHDGISDAVPLAFDMAYLDNGETDEPQSVVATGVSGGGPAVEVTEGGELPTDPHFVDDPEEVETTREVLIDQETARTHNISVGDTVSVGGSLTAAQDTQFTVVGISSTFEEMSGAPTVTLPLNEFHRITGTTETEPATFITITVEDDADVEAVQQDLESAYPEYEIRSNQEQLSAVLQEQVIHLAAAGALIVLALSAGVALTVSLLSLVVYQQRQTFAALTAQGVSSSLLICTVIGQGLVIGVLGGTIGVALTPPAVIGLNRLSELVVGFEGLVQTAPWVYGVAVGIAVGIGTSAAMIAGWRVSRSAPLDHL